MTNEEAIEVLEQDMFSVYCTDLKEAMGMAVNSLKAWDKIRAEVEQLQKEQSDHYGNETDTAKYDAYDDCLNVIDKYREVIYEADSN